jgi:glycerol-1-phosphatase
VQLIDPIGEGFQGAKDNEPAILGAVRMTIADEFDAFLIDLDGVVYIGDALAPGAGAAIEALRARGKHLLFLTNDPRRSRVGYAQKLESLGVPATEADILTSGSATATYIAEHERVVGRSVFVVGTDSLKEEMAAVGLQVKPREEARDAAFVVVGGHEDFDYGELKVACQALWRGASFYATNRDPTFPMLDGPWPATGAILAAVETASGRRAEVIGKPEPHMFETALLQLGERLRTAVVGDSLSSDVAGGRSAGLSTIWIAPRDVESDPGIAPDFQVPDLSCLLMKRYC